MSSKMASKMASSSSWPTTRTRPISRDDDSNIEPNFEQPEYFHRAPGKGGWLCSACATLSFNAKAAIQHEKSQDHKNTITVFTTWEPIQVDNWGESTGPLGQLRSSDLSEKEPPRKRVKRWIREIARAEGIEVEEEIEEEKEARWDDWTADAGDDWMRPTDEWGFPKNPPPEEGAADPRAAADFKFVEKVARARGLTKDRRRLHAFYRLPTDEKINRIQEIVHFISAH